MCGKCSRGKFGEQPSFTAHPGFCCHVIWFPLHFWPRRKWWKCFLSYTNGKTDDGCVPQAWIYTADKGLWAAALRVVSCMCVLFREVAAMLVLTISVFPMLWWERRRGSLTAWIWQASWVRSESWWKLICSGNVITRYLCCRRRAMELREGPGLCGGGDSTGQR